MDNFSSMLGLLPIHACYSIHSSQALSSVACPVLRGLCLIATDCTASLQLQLQLLFKAL